MVRLRARIARIARTEVTVLLTGETGTGKSTAARAIHAGSPRGEGPFRVVNCPGIPETLFESELFGHERGAFTGAVARRAGLMASADGGTLLLDEIGELPPGQQAKLLMALEERRIRPVGGERERVVDVRVIAATVRDLSSEVREGRFRADLFHRIAVLQLRLPALRERPEDIPALAEHHLAQLKRRHGRDVPALAPDALRYLQGLPWWGNVRELVHRLEAALVLSEGRRLGVAELRDAVPAGQCDPIPPSPVPQGEAERPLPPPDPGPGGARYSFYGDDAAERDRIQAALRRARGNRTHAARALGMSRGTLRQRIRKYGLEGC